MINLTTLGTFALRAGEQVAADLPTDKVRALLVYLALESPRPHRREALAALLWPDILHESALNNLRQTLHRLRTALDCLQAGAGSALLTINRKTVQIHPAQLAVDALTFTHWISEYQSHAHPNLASCDGCLARLTQAVALYQGELLAGFGIADAAAFEEWLLLRRENLQHQALLALTDLAAACEKRGDYALAHGYAERLLALDAYQEASHRQVMRLLARRGLINQAVAHYESYHRLLATELSIEPAPETTTLYTQIRDGQMADKVNRPSPPPVIVSSGPLTPRHNLPPQPTPFIGRKIDLEQIVTRLQDPTCRLLTIIGPGGMGKTRLAIQAAQVISALDFVDGVYFVALAGVGSPALLVSTIAATLDFTFAGSGDPQTQLLDYLHAKTLLLVLDNFEHLLDSAALVSVLLAAAPWVKVLATSRELLNLREEWLHFLSGMSYPGTAATGKIEEYTAIQLFAQCARQVRPGFDASGEVGAIAWVCRLVEGMPLGIELAATWLKLYSCTQIAEEITRDLDFLATALRNVPARHRSMRAIFEHSWRLLSPDEQQVLERLAIFRGGFTQAAAEAVAGASRALLLALVEKSLVQQSPAQRFQFHELMRQFAEEKLFAEAQIAAEIEERHSLYYLSLLKEQTARLKGRQQLTTTATLDLEIENSRTAWQWGVAHQKVDAIDGALESLCIFYVSKYWFQEGETLLGQAVARLRKDELAGKPGILIGRLLLRQGVMAVWFAWTAGEASYWEKGAALYQESITILNQLDAPAETALAISALGALHFHLGKFEQANQSFEQALRIFTAQDNRVEMGRILHELGVSLAAQGNYQEAIQTLQQGSELCEQSGDLRMRGEVLNSLAQVHMGLEEYTIAHQMMQAILSARTVAGDQRGMASSLALLGDLAWRMGDYATAQHYSQESLSLLDKTGLNKPKEVALNNLGNIACSVADYRQAHEHFRAVLAINLVAGRLHYDRPVAVALTGMATVLIKQGQRMQAAELLQLVLHHPATWQEMKHKATHLLTALAAELPADALAATQVRLQTQDLAAFVMPLLTAP